MGKGRRGRRAGKRVQHRRVVKAFAEAADRYRSEQSAVERLRSRLRRMRGSSQQAA